MIVPAFTLLPVIIMPAIALTLLLSSYLVSSKYPTDNTRPSLSIYVLASLALGVLTGILGFILLSVPLAEVMIVTVAISLAYTLPYLLYYDYIFALIPGLLIFVLIFMSISVFPNTYIEVISLVVVTCSIYVSVSIFQLKSSMNAQND